jgi:MtaA/CmuA family methyltransferase
MNERRKNTGGLDGLVFPINALPAVKTTSFGIDEITWSAERKLEAVARYYERVDADVLFCFTDTAIQAETMGVKVTYHPDLMPYITAPAPAVSAVDVKKQKRLRINADVISGLASRFPGKIIAALVYAPFTVAGQVMGEHNFLKALHRNPSSCSEALDRAYDLARDYGSFLLDRGADIFWLSDPLSSLVSPDLFQRFACEYNDRLFREFEGVTTAIHVCGNTRKHVSAMVRTGVRVISLDQCMDLCEIREHIPPQVTITGNLDPVEVMELSGPEKVENETGKLAAKLTCFDTYALSTGCAPSPTAPVENVARFVSSGKQFMAELRSQTTDNPALRGVRGT